MVKKEATQKKMYLPHLQFLLCLFLLLLRRLNSNVEEEIRGNVSIVTGVGDESIVDGIVVNSGLCSLISMYRKKYIKNNKKHKNPE